MIPKAKTLMGMLAEAGYPASKMYHHESDLYVFKTELTTRVIQQWCKANGYSFDVMVDTFRDQITGNAMYDVAFQYMPYWKEKANRGRVDAN